MNPYQTPTKDKKSSNRPHYDRSKRRKLTYQSGKRCECCTCGQYFNTSSTIDAHRVGNFGAKKFSRWN